MNFGMKLNNCLYDPYEAGCDEAGRGCLAGPVVAAAVILGKEFRVVGVNDSKAISQKKRNELRLQIEQNALAWAVAFVYPKEIDEINILNASFLAMHKAVKQLQVCPSFLLIDGNRFTPYPNIKHECIVKGDSKYTSIAAASVLAKTHRDEYMQTIHAEYPMFEWQKNKGYPTKHHRLMLTKHGITPYHRQSFRLINQQQELIF